MRWQDLTKLVIVLVTVTKSTRAAMEGFIVNGDIARHRQFPHSVFLKGTCKNDTKRHSWLCGASIINQRILLTAGHCITDCPYYLYVNAIVGHRNRLKGSPIMAKDIIVHERYDKLVSSNDIGLVLLEKPLVLSRSAKRVALYKRNFMKKRALVAGWGKIHDEKRIYSEHLMFVNQIVLTRKKCMKLLGWIPRGTICGINPINNSSHPTGGDSGSALVVDGYKQIGLVSHKYPSVSNNIVVYTEVAYHYNWIVKNTRRLFCT